MPREQRPGPRRGNAYSSPRLEERLILLPWLHDQLGYGATKELLNDIGAASEGFDSDGRSDIYWRLVSRSKLNIPHANLQRYDDNIRAHLE